MEMDRRIKRSITLLFICVTQFAMAQVPGYMGKKMVVGYDIYMSPTVAPTYKKQDGIGLNNTQCLNFDYTIKQRVNACVSLQYSKMGVTSNYGYSYVYNSQYYGPSNGIAYYRPTDNLPMQMKTYNLSLGFKLFSRNSIAPVGKYIKAEAIVLMNKLTYDPNAFYGSSSGTGEQITLGTGSYSGKRYSLAFTVGRQHILFNKIVLDMGTRVGLFMGGLVGYLDLQDRSDKTLDEALRIDSGKRLLSNQFINFHIGIGFLAF